MTDFGRGQRRWGRGLQGFAPVLVAAVLAWAPAAHAKVGDGFKVGPGRIRLGLELNGRYDSMAVAGLVGANGGGNVASPGDGIGLLRGGFQLDVPWQNVKLNLSGGLDWNNYLSAFADTHAFSFLGANLVGAAAFNPGGAFGVDVAETFNRSDRTNNPLFAVGVLGLSSATKVRAWGKPGGGAIEVAGSYELGVDAYSPQVSAGTSDLYKACPEDPQCNPLLAAAFNSLLNRVGIDAKWRLLPKTGLTFEANYGWKSYLYGSSLAGTQAASPIRAVLGFGTLLSTRFTFALRAGYGGIVFAGAAPTRHDVIGQAEVGYRVTETLAARVGFLRSDEPVAGASLYYADNRLYADFRGQFNRVVASAIASVDFVSYGGTARFDTNFGAGVTADYNINDWLRLTSRLAMTTRGVSGGPASSDFTRWEMGLGGAALF